MYIRLTAPLPTTLDAFKAWCKLFEPVGSRVTCNPPPLNTDEDFLAWVPSTHRAREALEALGFRTTTEASYQSPAPISPFESWRLGDINILVSSSEHFCNGFLAATHVAKRLNLLNKSDRIALFQAVLYRNKWDGK